MVVTFASGLSDGSGVAPRGIFRPPGKHSEFISTPILGSGKLLAGSDSYEHAV